MNDLKIIEEYSLKNVVPLHRNIFGFDFPIESYNKKSKENKLRIFVYYVETKAIGYSIIVDQAKEKNLYAWYGGVIYEFQGKGITKNFFNLLFDIARNSNYESVTVATSNLRPHMIISAIRLGFDIVDLKKRETGEGNKIYFKYQIDNAQNKEISIDLINKNPNQVEKEVVKAYKKDCSQINFSGIENYGMLIYAIDYLNSFANHPKINIVGLEKDKMELIQKKYLGEVLK